MTSDLMPFETICHQGGGKARSIWKYHFQDLNVKRVLLLSWVICYIINGISLRFTVSVSFRKHILVAQQS